MISLPAFRDELVKIATVPPEIKSYRRAIGLMRGGRYDSRINPSGDRWDLGEGASYDFHGTNGQERLANILNDGRVRAGHSNYYGDDAVYSNRGFIDRTFRGPVPRNTSAVVYPVSQDSEFISSRMQETGGPWSRTPRDVQLGRGVTVVAPKPEHLTPELTEALREARIKHRLRVVPASAYHAAARNPLHRMRMDREAILRVMRSL